MVNLTFTQLQYAFLTIAIELPIFWICGYHKFRLLVWFFLTNLVSNLLLNGALPSYTPSISYWLHLAVGEFLVVLLEYTLMRYLIYYEKVKLFVVVCITNAISLGIGLILLFNNIFLGVK